MVLEGDDIKNSLARIALALERVAYNLDRLTTERPNIVFTQVPEARVRKWVPPDPTPSLTGGGRQADGA